MAPVIEDSEEEDYSDPATEQKTSKQVKSSDSDLSDGELDIEDEDDLEEDDDDLNDTARFSDGEIPVSEDEEAYQIDDLDDIDEDLEFKDEEEKAKPKISVSSGSSRDTRKRLSSYYEDDEEIEKSVKSTKRSRVQQATGLDADLILTDEEVEYNPHVNFDQAKLTSRQRAMYDDEEGDGKGGQFLELEDAPMKTKKKVKETEQEAALRKAESARRRLDYKNKQLEEEKQDTLNKLLKRRANKTKEVYSKEGVLENPKMDKPIRPSLKHPALFRFVNNTSALNGNSILSFNAE